MRYTPLARATDPAAAVGRRRLVVAPARRRSACADPSSGVSSTSAVSAIRGSTRIASTTRRCRSSAIRRPGGIHTSREKRSGRRPDDRQLVLDLDDRSLPAFGDQAVGRPTRWIDIRHWLSASLTNASTSARRVRHRPIGQHPVAVLFEIAFDGVALLPEIRRRDGEVDRARAGRRAGDGRRGLALLDESCTCRRPDRRASARSHVAPRVRTPRRASRTLPVAGSTLKNS